MDVGNMHKKYGEYQTLVPEICSWTDRQTVITILCLRYRGEVIKTKQS